MHRHGVGAAGMHNQVRAVGGWDLSRSWICCFPNGFLVFLTADHGNVESSGVDGQRREYADVEASGRESTPRVSAPVLRRGFDAISWKPSGLPEDFSAVVG